MRTLRLITAPASEPISTAEARDWVEQDNQAVIDGLPSVIARSRRFLEQRMKLALLTQTWELTLDYRDIGPSITIPRPPLQSITSIQTIGSATGTATTVSSSNYRVVSADPPNLGKVVLLDGQLWGSDIAESGGMVITFVAGWTSKDAINGALLTGLSELVAFWCTHKGAGLVRSGMKGGITHVPPEVEKICSRIGYLEVWGE